MCLSIEFISLFDLFISHVLVCSIFSLVSCSFLCWLGVNKSKYPRWLYMSSIGGTVTPYFWGGISLAWGGYINVGDVIGYCLVLMNKMLWILINLRHRFDGVFWLVCSSSTFQNKSAASVSLTVTQFIMLNSVERICMRDYHLICLGLNSSVVFLFYFL